MSSSLLKVEQALLIGQWDGSIKESDSSIYKLAHQTTNGEFKAVLTSGSARSLLRIRLSGAELWDNSIESWFELHDLEELSVEENELLRLIIGIACLHSFIQVNWTGPDLDITPSDILFNKTIQTNISNDGNSKDSSAPGYEERLNRKAIGELAYGGEPAYHLAQSTGFFRLAQILFDYSFSVCRSGAWWRLRAARIHQHILDEPVPVPPGLTDPLEQLYSDVASERDLAGRLALECGLLANIVGKEKYAKECFVRAARYTGLEYELTGALGKRTKFQQTEVSQLVLLAESRTRSNEEEKSRADLRKRDDTGELDIDERRASGKTRLTVNSENGETDASEFAAVALPETLALNDDTLLEQTVFTSSSVGAPGSRLGHLDPSAQPPLHPLDQCILLSLCLNVKNTSPAHGLTQEQMKPYVARVISHPRNWSVHTMALLLRSRLEAERTRTVERSVLQLQALVDQMPSADSPLSERLLYIHSLPMPSKWELEGELAMRFLSLGVVRSALEIFERLEMWEEAVKCWQTLEKSATGIEIVRDLLEGRKEESETVIQRSKATNERRRPALDVAREAKLWCLLGDLEPQNAVEHYSRAWEVSREKSGRAMRSLGGYYFSHGEFAKAIECLRKGAAINPLLSRPWFILGCACVREERWEEARDAFSRCVSIDDEDGESWNNLASVYLRMGSTTGTVDKADKESEDRAEESTIKQEWEPHDSIPLANKLLAFRALKTGLKHSYDNWRMWTNYMIVAMDVGEFAEAARAQARVVEERAAKVGADAVDEDVLDRLVDAVIRAPEQVESDTPVTLDEPTVVVPGSIGASRSPNEGEGLRPRVLDLFERVILPRVSSQRMYRAYARLVASQGRWSDAVKYYLDSYRLSSAAMMEKGGEADKTKWLDAVRDVEEIVDVLRNFGPRAEDEEGRKRTEENTESSEVDGVMTRPGKWKMQARSIIRTFMARTRDAFEDDPDWSKLVELLEELKQ
ncbi:TPR-like protein [Fomitiporia mediterranea MF3/22]|uniref:TPR-like protein n=1 Tax=Fomitiporia mediterranea (strain MF3/22) TaxID=694068 RepID=UPI0004408707|nr:TPR-like protein [Fomitiporia mediterranea MF3/22]EJD01697.1 TPR-like protein [Fomitiporia mediterranea MF3/22]